MLLAVAALAATAGLSWFSYRSVRSAMTGEFERRLAGLAGAAASQVGPEDVADAARIGAEGLGYGALQLLLEPLRTTPGTRNAALLDSARGVVFDGGAPEREGLPTPLDTLARAALDQAYAGATLVTGVLEVDGERVRVGLAPVRAGGRTIAVVAVEASPAYLDALGGLGRRLWLTTAVIGLAILVFAGVLLRMEATAVRLERRLSRAENLAAMGRLTATLAHEIKNPLAIIRGSAQRLGRVDPEAARMADYIVEEADRLSATVSRYLQFARADTATEGAGDAAVALRATLDLLAGELRSRQIELEAGAGPDAAPVRIDNESLKQIYLNLILNAVEAMPGGGRLAVSLAATADGFELLVTDSGEGMAAETLRQAAEPFFTTKAQGSGLGLFLTRRLVQAGGGSLDFTSRAGQGTSCRVRLPRRHG